MISPAAPGKVEIPVGCTDQRHANGELDIPDVHTADAAILRRELDPSDTAPGELALGISTRPAVCVGAGAEFCAEANYLWMFISISGAHCPYG
jgi:hypothetical protein